MDEGRFHSYEGLCLKLFFLFNRDDAIPPNSRFQIYIGTKGSSLHYLIWHNIVWDTILYINVHSNQEVYFLEEVINDIVCWLKDESSCLINKMNYEATRTKRCHYKHRVGLSLMKQHSKHAVTTSC